MLYGNGLSSCWKSPLLGEKSVGKRLKLSRSVFKHLKGNFSSLLGVLL